jgi:hypothetical protein
VAREVPNKDGRCKTETGDCRSATFAVSQSDGQVVQISEDFRADFVDDRIKAQRTASELLEECYSDARRRAADAGADSDAAVRAMDDLVRCVEGGVASTIEKLNEEVAFQATVRKSIAERLENHTCLDATLNTTEDVHTAKWNYKGKTHVVHVKHDRPASRIHVVEGFIDDEECLAMEQAAEKGLHRATVADGKGGSRLSEHRKALQAGISVPWSEEANGNAIARLSRRVYDYTNHVLGLNLKEHGQEDLMSIQVRSSRFQAFLSLDVRRLSHLFVLVSYAVAVRRPRKAGRGAGSIHPALRRRLHRPCAQTRAKDGHDGHVLLRSRGGRYVKGGLWYLFQAAVHLTPYLGHTNFRNAGVHVKPERGNAIFFSYIDPETKIMDTGFTEHSGCPVFEGSKKIVTQWIRLGVDSENPWDSYNTLGVSKKDLAEYDSTAGEADLDDDEEAEYNDEDGEDEDEDDSFDDHEGDEL